MSGTVKDASSKEMLVGATIIATHQPTGTRYTTLSRAGGEYAISNMRVGGPYLIQISFVGYDLEKADEVYLKLAENFIVNSELAKTIGTLENVIVIYRQKKSHFEFQQDWSRNKYSCETNYTNSFYKP